MTTFRFHYSTYAPELDQSFKDTKDIQAETQEEAETSFRLFAYSLFSGNWSIDWLQVLHK